MFDVCCFVGFVFLLCLVYCIMIVFWVYLIVDCLVVCVCFGVFDLGVLGFGWFISVC